MTEEEKTEHGVAAERRRMRLVYADTIKDLLAHCAIQDGEYGYTHKRAAGVLKPPLSGRRKRSPKDLCPWWPEDPLASWVSRSLPGKAGAGVTQSQPSGSGDGVGTY